jgi:hypothetical protein
MAHKQANNDQFLRRAFDFAETVTANDVRRTWRHAWHSLDRHTKWLIVSILASLILMWVVINLAQALIAAIQWTNRPTWNDRLTAPYNLESRIWPAFDLSNPTAVLPAAADKYALQAAAAQPGLLAQCLLSADGKTPAICTIDQTADYVETGLYQNTDGHTVTVSTAHFETAEVAKDAALNLFMYSRSIGRIGNYVLVPSRSVDYYYSSTRDQFSFTWSSGPWVYTASSTSLDYLEQVIMAFPY